MEENRIGWGVMVRDKYLMDRFFNLRKEAIAWGKEYFSYWSKRKTWRGIKNEYQISFVKCELKVK